MVQDNSISFWMNLVHDFFEPGALKRWCLSSYSTSPVGRHAQGLFPMVGCPGSLISVNILYEVGQTPDSSSLFQTFDPQNDNFQVLNVQVYAPKSQWWNITAGVLVLQSLWCATRSRLWYVGIHSYACWIPPVILVLFLKPSMFLLVSIIWYFCILSRVKYRCATPAFQDQVR